MEESKNPKVFISYSWSSPTHEKFVLELAERLTVNGVNIIIDKWDLKEGQDKYVFMESMVTDPNVQKVLIISDKKYAEKADARKGGVGTESQIISSEIYDKTDQVKFIPIVSEFDEEGKPYLPKFLKNRIFINLSPSDFFPDEYDKLLRNIYNKPLYKRPLVGTPPAHLFEENVVPVVSYQEFNILSDAIKNEKRISKTFTYEYFEKVLVGLEELRVPNEQSDLPLDEQIYESISNMKIYRDQLIDIIKLIASSIDETFYYDTIFEFLEKALLLNSPPTNINSFNEMWFDNYRFFNMEFFIYLTAILIKYKRIDELLYFVEEKYFINSGFNKGNYTFSIFNSYLHSLEETRKKRLNLNRISLTADYLKDRCDRKEVSFEEFMQADFILCLKSTFDKEDNFDYWYPRTILYKSWHDRNAFPLFMRAESARHFNIIKKIFSVNSKDELNAKFEKADAVFGLKNWRFDYRNIQFKLLMNLENIYKA